MGGGRSVPPGQQVEVDEHEEIVRRVAAIDVAKASGMVCTRVPHQAKPSKRITRVWQVGSTTNQLLELADQLVGEGIERIRLRGHLGRTGAAKHPDQPDDHGHERTPNPQAGPAARWSLDRPKLAYNDAVTDHPTCPLSESID
jgi:hypothetical protein